LQLFGHDHSGDDVFSLEDHVVEAAQIAGKALIAVFDRLLDNLSVGLQILAVGGQGLGRCCR